MLEIAIEAKKQMPYHRHLLYNCLALSGSRDCQYVCEEFIIQTITVVYHQPEKKFPHLVGKWRKNNIHFTLHPVET